MIRSNLLNRRKAKNARTRRRDGTKRNNKRRTLRAKTRSKDSYRTPQTNLLKTSPNCSWQSSMVIRSRRGLRSSAVVLRIRLPQESRTRNRSSVVSGRSVTRARKSVSSIILLRNANSSLSARVETGVCTFTLTRFASSATGARDSTAPTSTRATSNR